MLRPIIKMLIILNRVALVVCEHFIDPNVGNQVILNPQDDQGVIPFQSRISQGSQLIHRGVILLIRLVGIKNTWDLNRGVGLLTTCLKQRYQLFGTHFTQGHIHIH